jgi:hypothetical protein
MPSYKSRLKFFLGLDSNPESCASTQEIETFIFLANTRPFMAMDFINCWLHLRSIEKLPDFILRKPYFFDILSKVAPKPKKGKK